MLAVGGEVKLQAKLIAALLAFIALAGAVLAYGHWQYTRGVQHTATRYELAIKKQQAEAATLLSDETEKTRLLERALQAATHQQELKDATHQKAVSDLSDRLRRLAGFGMRLRDPNATPAGCWPSGGGAQGPTAAATGGRPADGAKAGGLLSAELTGLLQQLQREADDINVAYASCRTDTYAVRAGQ